jgi:hypothetical protein
MDIQTIRGYIIDILTEGIAKFKASFIDNDRIRYLKIHIKNLKDALLELTNKLASNDQDDQVLPMIAYNQNNQSIPDYSNSPLFNQILNDYDKPTAIRTMFTVNQDKFKNEHPDLIKIDGEYQYNDIKQFIDNKTITKDNVNMTVRGFDLSAAELTHINQVLSLITMKYKTTPSYQTIPLKDLVLEGLNDSISNDNPKSSNYNSDQVAFIQNMINLLSEDNSKLWNNFKLYFNTQYKINIDNFKVIEQDQDNQQQDQDENENVDQVDSMAATWNRDKSGIDVISSMEGAIKELLTLSQAPSQLNGIYNL